MIDIYIKILLIAIGIAAVDKIHLKKRNDGILLGRSFPFKKVYWDYKRYYHLVITGVTGTGKSVLTENIDTYDKFQPFNQVKAEIEIKNTIYGVKLQIMAV